MIVRNESTNIEHAIASVRDVADEIIVVDTGSSDNTVAVSQALGATVADFVWNDDFAAARDYAIDLANGAWILSLDADEVLASTAIETLRAFVSNDPAGPTIATIDIISTFDSGEAEQAPAPRLASNHPDIRFERPIHEELGSLSGRPVIRFHANGVHLDHHGYKRAERSRQTKEERNLRLLLASVEREPTNLIFQYYLSLEYAAQGMYREAILMYQSKIAAMESDLPRHCAIRAFLQYGLSLEGNGYPRLAAEIVGAAADRLSSAALHVIAAQAFLNALLPPEASEHVEAAIQLANTRVDEVMPKANLLASAYLARGEVARFNRDHVAASIAYIAAIRAQPKATHARVRIAEMRASQGDLVGARDWLLNALQMAPNDESANIVLARIERRMGILQEPVDRLFEVLGQAPRNLVLRLELADLLFEAKEHQAGIDSLPLHWNYRNCSRVHQNSERGTTTASVLASCRSIAFRTLSRRTRSPLPPIPSLRGRRRCWRGFGRWPAGLWPSKVSAK